MKTSNRNKNVMYKLIFIGGRKPRQSSEGKWESSRIAHKGDGLTMFGGTAHPNWGYCQAIEEDLQPLSSVYLYRVNVEYFINLLKGIPL